VSSFSAFFLFPLIISQQGGNRQDIGIIMGTFAFAAAVSRPWVADMIDRVGRKKTYTFGCLIMALMPLLHLLLSGTIDRDYPFLLAIRIVHGVGLAACFTAIMTFIVDLIPVNRLNEGVGIFGSSGLVALAAGPLFAEFFLDRFGVPSFFLCASALAVLALVLQAPVRELRHCEQAGAADTPSFFALLRTRKHLVTAGLALLFGVGLAATGNFISPFAEHKSLGLISSYYLAYSCAAVGIRFISGRMADRIGEEQIIPWALFIAAGGLFLVPAVNGNILLLTVGFIFGLGHGLLFPSLNAMAVRNEPYAVRGKITGIFTGGIDCGSFLGAFVLGAVGQLGGYTLLFSVAGLILMSGLVLFRFRHAGTPKGH
jgi:MFS family permease